MRGKRPESGARRGTDERTPADHRDERTSDLLADNLALGTTVQLVYADDGKTVQAVQVLPDMRRQRMMVW